MGKLYWKVAQRVQLIASFSQFEDISSADRIKPNVPYKVPSRQRRPACDTGNSICKDGFGSDTVTCSIKISLVRLLLLDTFAVRSRF